MKTKNELRSFISATGSFVSLPEAFEAADSGVKLAPKIELQVGKFPDSKHPLGFDFVMHPHQILIDLEAVDSDQFDAKKLIKDCELMISACREHPEDVRKILAAFSEDAPHKKMLAAEKIAEKLNLTESKAVKAGGGLLWLVVVAAAIALSSCKGCAHTKGRTRQ
jgi:hypothetical protein